MDPQSKLKNLSLCRRFAQRVINQRNPMAARDFVAEDSIHHEIAGVPQGCQRGPRAMERFLKPYLRAFPDLRILFEDAIADRDRVVTRWRLEGTHEGPLMGIPASGNHVSIEGIRIDRIENGRIAESWMQMDSLSLLEQIGALPRSLSLRPMSLLSRDC
jgi:steroid delta-isomerase-like uncharacterized protein